MTRMVIGPNFYAFHPQWTSLWMINQVAAAVLLPRGPVCDVTVLQEHLLFSLPVRKALSAVPSPSRKVKMPPDKTAACHSINANLLCSCSRFPIFFPCTFFHLFKDSWGKKCLPPIWCSKFVVKCSANEKGCVEVMQGHLKSVNCL